MLCYYLAGGSQVTKRAEGDESAAGGETAAGTEIENKNIYYMSHIRGMFPQMYLMESIDTSFYSYLQYFLQLKFQCAVMRINGKCCLCSKNLNSFHMMQGFAGFKTLQRLEKKKRQFYVP